MATTTTSRPLLGLLEALRRNPESDQTNRILSSATSLLTTLSNPLNITLLTTILLTGPALWGPSDGLTTSYRIISVFNTAAIAVHKHQTEGGATKPYDAYQPRLGGGLTCDKWTTAVLAGLNERSQRWQHALVSAGVLLGMESSERRGLSPALRGKIENALATASTLVMREPAIAGPLGVAAAALALNYGYPLFSDMTRRMLDYDAMIMPLLTSMTSFHGYENGHFVEAANSDIRQVQGRRFDWSPASNSFRYLQALGSKPLVASVGSMSRIISDAIERCSNPHRAIEALDHLLGFTGILLSAWEANKLSELDTSEEETFLTPETRRITYPALWQLLKGVMFSTVVILRSIVAKTVTNSLLSSNGVAPTIASKSLLILRNIHFISSRTGSNSLSALTFINLASIDILNRFPLQARDFLKSIHPAHPGQIPTHPLQRSHDLFYLNTVEHFTLIMSPATAENLIFIPASPYLNPTANVHLLEIFEAAHSAMLAMLAAPQSGPLTAKVLPFYVESLFNSFPTNLSPRQFRFAFKSLMQLTTPPAPISATEPQLAETLLEFLHHRALNAPTSPLPPSMAIKSQADAQTAPSPPLSEQAILLLTLLDALPNLPLNVLEEWLPLSADLLNAIPDAGMREHCKRRFWELMESGEMDIDRSAVCVAWWSSRGGREMVLFGKREGPFMSGGLGRRESLL
ncbi:hypothetical protein GLAREA_07818 [Glarea lozoyensis ATCC 20868]|uniref:Peroxisomal membrane protein PEX17 n=1 Tax=Glarea lozoyensis (strain ATCC 20868 / MF5171) TaxID=1116229 RepID=S3D6C4_GLAL2|nr:uncharacterized protein GLAREA_07818 [Glarea lozoyensis ATCC 20868]EPE32684.1 hypothetical protein GLAREA_07818 [Glarea lozoyensis ATCC 20868]